VIERFHDRREAGQLLAVRLEAYRDQPDAVVLALPRGGVPVGYEVATALNLPLDVFIVRKLGFPSQPELAMGAIAEGGARVLNDEIIASLNISPEVIEGVAAAEERELERRVRAYRDLPSPPRVNRKTVILVDDGLATGATMRAAALAARHLGARRIVAAVPVGAAECVAELRGLCDEVVCLDIPHPLYAIGCHYEEFDQVSDEEVRELLERVRHSAAGFSGYR